MKDYYIFDLDGTLYQFDDGGSSNFSASRFYANIRKNILQFLSDLLSISEKEASEKYNDLKDRYDGETSLAVEQELGVDRLDFFAATWSLEPAEYLKKNSTVRDIFEQLEDRVAVLTAAPRVWAARTLEYLDIMSFVEDTLFTGESDLRKPDPRIFKAVADSLGVPPEQCVSIGDQEYSDIIPAKSVGMRTVIVGSPSNYADIQIDCIDRFPKIIRNGGILRKSEATG